MIAELIAVRHGESASNAAWAYAAPAARPHLRAPTRDADSPLTPIGVDQATALGLWFSRLPEAERPDIVIHSPFERARHTAAIILATLRTAGLPPPQMRQDERLRDRDPGIWELLSRTELRARYPDEPARLERLGSFYYRPPGGESMVDVALRLRTLLAELDRTEPGATVLLVGHDAVVLMLRLIVEGLTEADISAIETDGPVGNASVTRWRRASERLTLVEYNARVS